MTFISELDVNQNPPWHVVPDQLATLGECPVWDGKRNALYWIDILTDRLFEFQTRTKTCRTYDLPHLTGSIVLTDKGDLLAASLDGIYLIEAATRRWTIVISLGNSMVCQRFNDGKCDPLGRFWVGSMALPGYKKEGVVYAINSGYEILPQITGVHVSNGMAWNQKLNIFYHIDTAMRKIFSYKYDHNTGGISNAQTIIEFPAGLEVPDGLTIDSEGMLWVAIWNGGRIARWDPHNNTLLEEIKLPVTRVTSCTFGGEDLDELYVTSARTGLSESALEQQPLAGSLFIIKNTGYRGTPASLFSTQ